MNRIQIDSHDFVTIALIVCSTVLEVTENREAASVLLGLAFINHVIMVLSEGE